MLNGWLPSLNSLRAFEVVSRHLNYHSAATELNVTPAAVKQLVSKLENSIGGKLLKRQGRSLILTNKGKECCDDLTDAFQLMFASVEKMRQEENEKQLIVTVETSFATTWLVPKLDQFRARNPNINVLIDSNQHIADLKTERIDVAIRYGVESQNDEFVHRLFNDAVFPACSPSLVKGPPAITDLTDINSIPLIHWDMTQLVWAHETRKWFVWEKWLAHLGIENINTERGLYFSDYGQAVQAAIAGQGIFLASWPILRDPIDAGLLVRPFEQSITTDIGYDLVTTARAKERPEIAAFVDWIIETADTEASDV